MTREEALEAWLPVVEMAIVDANIPEAKEALEMAIKALEQEPFINKPCVSENVCEHDKQMVLDKIKSEILAMMPSLGIWMYGEGHIEKQTACEVIADVLAIIDKYKTEGSDKE